MRFKCSLLSFRSEPRPLPEPLPCPVSSARVISHVTELFSWLAALSRQTEHNHINNLNVTSGPWSLWDSLQG